MFKKFEKLISFLVMMNGILYQLPMLVGLRAVLCHRLLELFGEMQLDQPPNLYWESKLVI
jgi:hypothetical protein